MEGKENEIREHIATLEKAVNAMKQKIEQQIPFYEKMPLAQQVTVGTGEKMLRQNPAVQEFRATVRDYSAALNNLQNILEDNKTAAPSDNLEKLRQRFRVAT